ncbi:ribonuclease H-like domain-containing protein [Tanacetum coccineum]
MMRFLENSGIRLNVLWKQFDAMIELPRCTCHAADDFKKHNQLMKLIQFLMGLDDSYMQIRSSIMSREILPDVRSAYATISSEESHRVASGSIANMAGANQNMNHTDKELDNVFDISHLRIKVGHPNGTEAFISKIGNLRIPNDDQRSQSDSSYSSLPGGNINTADFPNDNSGNDAQSSDDIFATQDEQLNKNYEPKTFFEASKYSQWTGAMNNEMDDLLRSDTWEIVDLPKDRKAIGSKWIFKIKYKSSGEIDRYKARLVAQGFNQKEGIDYEETFSSVVKMVIVRKLFTIPTGRYVVPTGRVIATDSVIVATSGYVVPAVYDISPGLKDLSRAETYKWYQSLERVSVEE